jgi:3-isopropylmalate/(R)-2-methylmalate dehydratase small subunit
MRAFTTHTALAAPLLIDNIDTDAIIPKQFLKTLTREGLGKHLFHDLRVHEDGSMNLNFPLTLPGFRDAGILLTGANFGCGSSREHAPWALMDFGFRVIIAESFADIFHNNCFQNGLLPITLERDWITKLATHSGAMTVNLLEQSIQAGAFRVPFAMEASRKQMLLKGEDAIVQILLSEQSISSFEARQRQDQPWLYSTSQP